MVDPSRSELHSPSNRTGNDRFFTLNVFYKFSGIRFEEILNPLEFECSIRVLLFLLLVDIRYTCLYSRFHYVVLVDEFVDWYAPNVDSDVD